MRKKIIVGAVITAIAATSLFAAGKYCDGSNPRMGHGMNSNNMKSHNMGKHKSGFKMQKMFQMLNLTDEQQTKVDVIIKNHRDNKVSMSDSFTKTGFDKQKFIKFASQKRENMIKSKADMIEGIYNILNNEQKLQLKVLMDLKMNQMSKRFDSDKRSYGRG
jgi:Spy/CpxP family protein refolding chaperone